jgi:hypothetical protein
MLCRFCYLSVDACDLLLSSCIYKGSNFTHPVPVNSEPRDPKVPRWCGVGHGQGQTGRPLFSLGASLSILICFKKLTRAELKRDLVFDTVHCCLVAISGLARANHLFSGVD